MNKMSLRNNHDNIQSKAHMIVASCSCNKLIKSFISVSNNYSARIFKSYRTLFYKHKLSLQFILLVLRYCNDRITFDN